MTVGPEQIRSVLRAWILETQPHRDGDILIDELCFVDKRRRADLVHANGRLSAFEIKSAADTLTRWQSQQQAYLRVFDNVWLCCHSKHVEKAMSRIDKSTGLLVVDDYRNVAVIKNPRDNNKVDCYDLAGLLWRNELDFLCKEYGVHAPRSLRINEVRQRIADTLPKDTIRNHVLDRLKVRYSLD